MEGFGENVKKLLLAGIGAVATTAEKSSELLDEMVKKGELTVEQGKALNQELKHNIKKTMQEKTSDKETDKTDEMDAFLEKMTPEEMERLKEKLAAMESLEEREEGTDE